MLPESPARHEERLQSKSETTLGVDLSGNGIAKANKGTQKVCNFVCACVQGRLRFDGDVGAVTMDLHMSLALPFLGFYRL